MLAEFFSKGIMRNVTCAITIIFVVICTTYAVTLSKAKAIPFEVKVYFLVGQDMQVEAGAEFIKWNGGAGYLLECEGAQYAVISVFFDRGSAESVQERLRENGQKTEVLLEGRDTLYFKGKEKKNCAMYLSALSLFKNYMSVLENCIGRLENGMTQESCRRILTMLQKQFHYSARSFEGYTTFSKLCRQSEEWLEEVCKETIYLRDLRYLLCWQAEKYIKLCDDFSL